MNWKKDGSADWKDEYDRLFDSAIGFRRDYRAYERAATLAMRILRDEYQRLRDAKGYERADEIRSRLAEAGVVFNQTGWHVECSMVGENW